MTPVLPIVIPMIAGALSLVFWRSRRSQRLLAVLGTAAMAVSAVALLATCVGSYALSTWVRASAGPHAAWSIVGSAVVLILSVQGKAAA